MSTNTTDIESVNSDEEDLVPLKNEQLENE